MKITFSVQGTGAGDNGGTATIFHSANVLASMGHTVKIVSFDKSYFTWFKLEGVEYIKTKRYDYPDADVLIATGASSVKHVLNSPGKKGLKYWWVRAHETWITNHDNLLGMYRNPNIKLLVNSVHLQKFIHKRMGITPQIIRPGIDIDLWQSNRERDWERKEVFVLGGLYNEKPRKRFKWIPEIYEQLLGKKYKVKLYLFGTYDKPQGFPYDKYTKKPKQKTLEKFYNSVDFWLAPTKSEGLHIPPQEAMLCECIVFGACEELSGTADYLEHGTTGFITPEWSEAVDMIAKVIDDKDRKNLYRIARAGKEKIIELGTRQTNMENLLDLVSADLAGYRSRLRNMRHRRTM
jgi:glycosyltransferase involved in cell wall biosynthesis